MSPRKKSKPNPQAPADGTTTAAPVPPDASNDSTPTASTTLSDAEAVKSTPSSTSQAESSTTLPNGASTPSTTGSQTPRGKKWLGGTGSWRSKAPAVVKTKAESIGVTGGATGELPDAEAKKPRDDSPTKFLTKRKSSKGNALPTSITKVNVSSDGLTEDPSSPKPAETTEKEPEPAAPTIAEPPLPPLPPAASSSEQAANTWAWRSWWSRPDGYSEAGKARSEAQGTMEDARSTPLPGPTPSEESDSKTKGLDAGSAMASVDQALVNPASEQEEAKAANDSAGKDVPGTTEQSNVRNTSGSWFWRWSNAQNAQANHPVDPAKEETSKPDTDVLAEAPATQASPTVEDSQTQETATLTTADGSTESTSTVATTPPKPSAWAFWYRGKPDAENPKANGEPQKHVGEVAVFNTPSQSQPEAAQFNEQERNEAESGAPKEPLEPPRIPEPTKAESLAKRSIRSLRGLPKSANKAKDTPAETPSVSNTATPTQSSPVLGPTRPETAPAAQAAPKVPTKIRQEPPNLLLPEFKHTYQLVQQPNFWQQIRRYFLGGEDPMPHLHINPAPPRIKKAVAIGVHGFFPAPIIQKVLGQPTGTSIRFANAAAAAIKDWTEARGYTPEIEQIALEGEGFIAERVNTLWKLLLNWIDHIKQADFILVACHSQGVPVAMMLVAKLIQFGCVNATRIGVCAMAGVNMGPFIEYKTKYFGPTAAELFEFSNPKSLVSQMYLAALDEVLRFGVRIFYVGSIDDQLVSLEVSTYFPLP